MGVGTVYNLELWFYIVSPGYVRGIEGCVKRCIIPRWISDTIPCPPFETYRYGTFQIGKPFSIQFISWSTELSHEHSIVGPYSMTILQSLVFRLSKNQKRLVHTGVWTVVLLHHSTQGFRTPSHYAHHSISMCSRVHVRHHLKPLRTALVVHLGESCETPEVCSCVAEASLSRSPLEGSTDLGIVYGSWFATFFSSPLHPIPFLNGIWCLPAHSLYKRNPAFAGCLMLKEPSVTIFRSICTVPRNGHIH